jgi:Tol biopolymer transport system component
MLRSSSQVMRFGSIVGLAIALTGCSGGPSTPPSQAAAQSPAPTGAATAALMPGPSPTILRAKAEGQIVFVDEAGASKHAQIYIENADGTNVRHLVVSEFDDRGPALSPDGRKVAFARNTPEASPEGGVFVVNIDGTGLTQIDNVGGDVSWSPDGSQLVETRDLFEDGSNGHNQGLWIEKADGHGAHQITLKGMLCPDACAAWQDNEARWSPDGKRIAFLRDSFTSPEQYSVFTIAIDGSDLRRVTPEGMEVGNPHWSPDGTRILFQSPKEPVQGGEQNIYVINADGTGISQLTAHLTADKNSVQGTFHPCWSPDGTLVVFSHYPGPRGSATLYLMNADGSDIHLLADSPLDANAAEWGPLPTH